MYQSPLVIGVRQAPAWGNGETVEQTMAQLGMNTGNMMFTHSLVKVLKGAAWASFNFRERDIEGRDVIVLAAANWVNSYEDFGWLADKLEKTTLPVMLVGIGAQASNALELPLLKPGTLRLLSLVQDRSGSMAARGEFSCRVLESYGYRTGMATGCPSLLLAGREGPSIRRCQSVELADSCIHATRHGFQQSDPFQAYLYRQSYKHNMDIVFQSEFADICLALGMADSADLKVRAIAATRFAYAADDVTKLENYLHTKGHVFSNIDSWMSFMKTKSFCFGTRIHGVVASILSGTEATLIVHDSRTLEMAESMYIPHILADKLLVSGDVDVGAIHQPEQTELFTRRYIDYYNRFVEYFSLNGLALA